MCNLFRLREISGCFKISSYVPNIFHVYRLRIYLEILHVDIRVRRINDQAMSVLAPGCPGSPVTINSGKWVDRETVVLIKSAHHLKQGQKAVDDVVKVHI